MNFNLLNESEKNLIELEKRNVQNVDDIIYNDLGILQLVERNEYYPSLKSASKEQVSFYNYWKRELLKGVYIELESNLSYIFCYCYSKINKFVKDLDIESLEKDFNNLLSIYGHTKVKPYITNRLFDAHLLIGNIDGAINLGSEKLFIHSSDVLFITSLDPNFNINSDVFLWMFSKQKLTKFGRNNIKELKVIIDIMLNNFILDHGTNFIDYFCRDLKKDTISDSDIEKYREFFDDQAGYDNLKRLDKTKSWGGDTVGYSKDYGKQLFHGVFLNGINHNALGNKEHYNLTTTRNNEVILKSNFKQPGYVIDSALYTYGRNLVRECENTLREELGIPRIGEGWVSETELYYKISKHFENLEVIHHGRPNRLGRQHLDIYIPEINVGIEYQGKQHQEPVEYFGGQESFEKQQKRDKNKLKKCKKNNCKLIYVYEGYDLDSVVLEIEEQLDLNHSKEL